MVKPPSDLQWIMPRVYPTRMTSDEKKRGKHYKRPSDRTIYSVMKKIGIPRDDAARRVVEFLYDKSSVPSLYIPGYFSIYKTTEFVAKKFSDKKFRNRLRFKHLQWALATSYSIIRDNPQLKDLEDYEILAKQIFTFSRNYNAFKNILWEVAFKQREAKVQELVLKGKIIGYSQYDTNPASAFIGHSELLLTDNARETYLKFLDHIRSSDSPLTARLLSWSEVGLPPEFGFVPYYEEEVSVNLLQIYKRSRKKQEIKRVNKDDVLFVLKRRFGYLLKENETVESLLLNLDEHSNTL